MIRVFIGWDQRQPVSYNVCQQSIIEHASVPVSITPLVLETLPITRQGLTPFTYSRFLVPWLCDYEGTALFVDADTMFRGDVAELFALNDHSAVQVVKHERAFERPSLMLFNCAKCTVLTPEYVQNSHNPLKLDWASDVGSLPKEWNHLVGYDKPNPDAKMVHFTQGMPCYKEHDKLWNAEFAQEWRDAAKRVMTIAPWETLMGTSVHVPYVKAA